MPKTRLDFLIETVTGKINRLINERDIKRQMLPVPPLNEISFLSGAISAYEDILKDLKQLKEVENNED